MVGVDYSDTMVAMAAAALRALIADGRLRVVFGDVRDADGLWSALAGGEGGGDDVCEGASPPLPPKSSLGAGPAAWATRAAAAVGAPFDAIFHTNCNYFWPDNAAACRN